MILGHRCQVCDHNSMEAGRSGGTRCNLVIPGTPVCCSVCQWGPSMLMPRFDASGKLIRDIVPPGERWWQDIKSCSCDECQSLFANPPRIVG